MVLLKYSVFEAGYCQHLECMIIKGGKWRICKFPALSFLLEHPLYGYIVFDTGYSTHIFEATKKWPLNLYHKITPVNIQKEHILAYQLANKGITHDQVNYIIISHFHPDHIGGIKDFPDAKFFCSEQAYTTVNKTKGFTALKKGYFEGLMPNDFESRCFFIKTKPYVVLDKDLYPFTHGYDLYGDKSIMAIPLPGHAKGQFGIVFNDSHGKKIFLVADSCWSKKAFQDFKLPHFMTYLIHDNRKEYQDTLMKLHILYKNNSDIRIIPSHCHETY